MDKRRIIVVQPDDSSLFIEPLLTVSLDFNGERLPATNRRNTGET